MAGVELEAVGRLRLGLGAGRVRRRRHRLLRPVLVRGDGLRPISAGITIDLWFGEISFSVTLGASIKVEGPEFRASCDVRDRARDGHVEFGPSRQHGRRRSPWAEFVRKYLEEAAPGRARALAAITGRGTLPPRRRREQRRRRRPTAARPAVPGVRRVRDHRDLDRADHELRHRHHHAARCQVRAHGQPRPPWAQDDDAGAHGPPSGCDSVARPDRRSLGRRRGGPRPAQALEHAAAHGAYPIGAGGLAGPREPQSPAAHHDVIDAGNLVSRHSRNRPGETLPPAIPYCTVEAEGVNPLPPSSDGRDRAQVVTAAAALHGTTKRPGGGRCRGQRHQVAAHLLITRGARAKLDVRSSQAARRRR